MTTEEAQVIVEAADGGWTEHPSPGIYRNLSDSIYHGDPAWRLCSNSHLSALKRSPAHCWCAMQEPHDPTPAMMLGAAAHAAILEPDKFEREYAALPDGDGRSKAVKEAKKELEAVFEPDRILSRTDYDKCLRMRDAVWAHSPARRMLEARSDTEISAVWDDAETGVRMKMRTDLLVGDGIIGDLKSTEDAGRDAFERSVFKFGYYRQAAVYMDGWANHGKSIEDFAIIAFEKNPPYAVATYRMKDEVIELGHNEYRRLLSRFAECERSGVWPGYEEKFLDIALPVWAERQLERDGE